MGRDILPESRLELSLNTDGAFSISACSVFRTSDNRETADYTVRKIRPKVRSKFPRVSRRVLRFAPPRLAAISIDTFDRLVRVSRPVSFYTRTRTSFVDCPRDKRVPGGRRRNVLHSACDVDPLYNSCQGRDDDAERRPGSRRFRVAEKLLCEPAERERGKHHALMADLAMCN